MITRSLEGILLIVVQCRHAAFVTLSRNYVTSLLGTCLRQIWPPVRRLYGRTAKATQLPVRQGQGINERQSGCTDKGRRKRRGEYSCYPCPPRSQMQDFCCVARPTLPLRYYLASSSFSWCRRKREMLARGLLDRIFDAFFSDGSKFRKKVRRYLSL